ncbi:MAG: hypothetical protein Q4G27_07665 [Flavobacteriaceae bacterium]|nr:hypothetical protein [Flavobacteriaceae bacterium]
MKYFILILITGFSLISCKDSDQLSSRDASKLVEEYISKNPLYETGDFSTSQMRLRSEKDADLITEIRNLESENYIEIVDSKSRKKWFSKDSVMVITPVLTTKSTPFVVKQANKKTEVKTLDYRLEPKQNINFERKSKNSAVFNVVLLKEKTPFYSFGKDKHPNSEFITKKFKARYSKENGWELTE